VACTPEPSGRLSPAWPREWTGSQIISSTVVTRLRRAVRHGQSQQPVHHDAWPCLHDGDVFGTRDLYPYMCLFRLPD